MNGFQKAAARLLNIPIAPPVGYPTGYNIINGQIISSADNKHTYIRAYMVNDLVYSIVHLITEKVRVAPWGVYKVTDEQALKAYKAIISKKELSGEDVTRSRALRKKALEPYTGDSSLLELIKYPNDTQTFSDLVADSSIFKLIAGGRCIYADTLSMGANQGKPSSFHIMPYQDISLIVERGWPMKIVGYSLHNWKIIDIPAEKVLHDKYYNPSDDTNGMHLYGMAPLKAGLRSYDRSQAENDFSLASFQNGGPRAIIFTDDIRMTQQQGGEQALTIKKILSGYEGADNANRFAVSGYKMGVANVGLSPVEMAVIESRKMSLRDMCNLFGGVPVQLLNDTESSTYNNMVEAEKALTSRCALPLLTTFRDTFNRMLHQHWGYKDKNIIIDFDMSVYTELQEDQAKKWGWVKELPITNGGKLDMMAIDHPEGHDEFMDTILVPQNMATSEDYMQSEVDSALEEGAGALSPDDEGTDV